MTKKPKPKKTAYYRKKCDRLYQEIGVAENKRCMVCGGKYNCLHHWIPKSCSSALRYDFDNAIPICQKCHFTIHTKSDPYPVTKILEIKGDKWNKSLQKKRFNYTPSTIGYYKGIIEILEKRLDNSLSKC